MSWNEAAAEMAAALSDEVDGFGEPTDFTPAGTANAVRVSAEWGPVEPQEFAEGFRGDRCVVRIPEAELPGVAPKRRDLLGRYPGGASPAPETWEVDRAARADGAWRIDAVNNPTPVPRVR